MRPFVEHREVDLLREYVGAGVLAHVATLNADGTPTVVNVWYQENMAEGWLRFISKPSRIHSANIRRSKTVAGSIVHDIPAELGKPVRGVTFRGSAYELSDPSADAISQFVTRWPRSATALIGNSDTPPTSLIYEIRVAEWILFDELAFPDDPKRVIVLA